MAADLEVEKLAAEQEEPSPEADTTVQKDDAPEDSQPAGEKDVGEPVGEVKEEPQPGEQKHVEQLPEEQKDEEQKVKEPAADDASKSDDKPKPDESKPNEEAATAAVEQEPSKKQEAETQPAVPQSSAVTAEGGGEDATKVAEGVAVAEKKEEVKEKPKRPPRNKVCSAIPTEGVDLAIGEGELEGAEPITFGQLFKMTLEKYADVHALKWLEKEGEGEESTMVWKAHTYAQYYKLCVDAAKSLVKVSMMRLHVTTMAIVETIDGTL